MAAQESGRSIGGRIVGRGWRFPPAFSKRNRGAGVLECRAVMVEGLEEIAQSLRVLFGTSPGERPLRPRFGCDVKRFVFQEMSLTAVTDLQDMLSTAILKWEPRIRVNGIEIDVSQSQDGVLSVELDYTIVATNSRTNRVFPLYLQEGTNLQD